MTTRTLLAAAVAALAFSPMVGAQAQDLAGSQVTVAGYCCTTPLAPSDLVTNSLTRTVGPDDEFPQGSFMSTAAGFEAIPVTIDVGGTTIQMTYSAGGVAEPGGFNGFVFSFADAPAITGVTIDPMSTYAPVVTFNANTVFVNEAGLTLTPTSNLLLNVSAVPEPETYGMLVAGLGLLGLMARRRRG
jgi:hypothetical protein